MVYDEKQLNALFLRAKAVLGEEQWQTLADYRPRRDAFTTALSRATKAMSGPENVTDEQITGALEIAEEVFPVELGVLVNATQGRSK